MGRYLIKIFIPCLLVIGNFTNSLGQNEEDSLFNEINELLSIEVNEEKYISSASKYLGIRAHKKITEDLSLSLLENMFFTDGENYYLGEFDQSKSKNEVVVNRSIILRIPNLT